MARPRTVSLAPDEMIKLGEEMVGWFKNHPEALHVSQWYCLQKDITDKTWETMVDRAEFIPYYEKALKIIGHKYLDKDSQVRSNISDRWQRVYFKDLKRQEDQDADDEAERKLKSQSSIPPNDAQIDQENAEMSENARLRKENAALKAQIENKPQAR